MIRFKLIGGIILGALLVYSGFYLFKPATELSFNYYSDLKKENISSEELKEIIKIHHQCFDEPRAKNFLKYAKAKLYLGKNPSLVEAAVKKQLERINQSVDETFHTTEHVTVLREGAKIVGFYSCQKSNPDLDHAAVIWNLCVSPGARGKGYGTKLTQSAIKSCSKKGQDLMLLVYKDNPIAKKIYEKQGFKNVGWDYDPDSDFEYYNKFLMKYQGNASNLK